MCVPYQGKSQHTLLKNADKVKMLTLFVREIKIYAIQLVRGLFTKKSGSTITLLHERQNGVEFRSPFLTFLHAMQLTRDLETRLLFDCPERLSDTSNFTERTVDD